MYLKLAKQNLKTQKVKTALTMIGVTISAAMLITITALTNGIKQAVTESITQRTPINQIIVKSSQSDKGFLKSITSPQQKLTQETINHIKTLPHISSVYPQITYNNISSIKIDLLGQIFSSDAMIFGVPYEHIKTDITNKETWETNKEPYPALISQKILDLYNLTVAPSNNFPNFSKKDIIGLKFKILPGQSTFFPQLNSNQKEIEAQIVGFSDKVDLIGVTIPIKTVEKLNNKNLNQNTYTKLFVTIDGTKNIEPTLKKIRKMDLNATAALESIKVFEKNFQIISIGLNMIGLIIIILSGLTITTTFISNVNERKKEIGILRAIGATQKDIQKLFLTEAAIIGLSGAILGTIVAIVGGSTLNKIALSSIPDISYKPSTLLQYDLITIITIIIFITILSTIFAYLPARKAAKLNPLKALSS